MLFSVSQYLIRRNKAGIFAESLGTTFLVMFHSDCIFLYFLF
jgi:hypothetical protein